MREYLGYNSIELEKIIKENKETIKKLQKEGAKMRKALGIRIVMEEEIELELRKREEEEKITKYNELKREMDVISKELGLKE